MDIMMVYPKKKKVSLITTKDNLSDDVKEIKTSNPVVLQQEGKNSLSVAGTTFVKPYVMIQAHGDISCAKKSCIVKKPDSSFIPSKKAIQSVELSRRILNNYLSSHEGFIDKENIKPKKKRIRPQTFDKVNSVRVSHLKNSFSMDVDDRIVIAKEFLIDPVVIESVVVNKKGAEVMVNTNDAQCSFRKDSMNTPAKTVFFCSKSTEPDEAYKLKSYLGVYKEQMDSARGINLGRHRMRMSFSKSPSCETRNGLVCCKQDDDDEICY